VLFRSRCYWELMRPDLAREQFERARDVLEDAGPSEALAVAFIRLSGLAAFDRTGDAGLEEARHAVEIARLAGSSMALAWAWNFVALGECSSGRIDEGFQHLEDSFQAAVAGHHHFQISNAVYNAAWIAVHLGRGRIAQAWVDRIAGADLGLFEAWPLYLRALLALYQGRVDEAIGLARSALLRARDSGHQKNLWRGQVLLAHTLAEGLKVDEAMAVLPPVSSRVEGQDSIYDTAARVRTALAAGAGAGLLETARALDPKQADLGSPADAVAEAAMSDPAWLRRFVDQLPNQDVTPPLVRAEAARGRLALAEGRFDDAVRVLRTVEAAMREEGLLLDAWHAGRALAEAEARSGDTGSARARLEVVVSEAEPLGAALAARLARDTAAILGFDLAPSSTPAVMVNTTGRDVGPTGERMVTVLFADVRGYTAMTGTTAPAAMVDRIASLQRWAAQEVGKHSGLVDKYAGDSVMATFNVSGQSVDHPLHALKAAIAIIDKAALVGLPVGAGVAVGPAVVGRLAEAANVSVLGDVTNLAARLQAQASAGEVVLSEEAYRRVRDWLEERATGIERVELDLKGFDAPVVAYKVGARETTPSTR
jgi:class 3 adenylate cyclase